MLSTRRATPPPPPSPSPTTYEPGPLLPRGSMKAGGPTGRPRQTIREGVAFEAPLWVVQPLGAHLSACMDSWAACRAVAPWL